MRTPHSHSPFSGGGVNSSSTIVLKKEDDFVLPYSLLLPQASPFLHAKVGQLIWDSLADNVIEELPASLSNLVQLKSFCLDNNQVKQGEQLKRDSRWIAERVQDSAKSLNRSEGGEIDEKLDGGGRT